MKRFQIQMYQGVIKNSSEEEEIFHFMLIFRFSLMTELISPRLKFFYNRQQSRAMARV